MNRLLAGTIALVGCMDPHAPTLERVYPEFGEVSSTTRIDIRGSGLLPDLTFRQTGQDSVDNDFTVWLAQGDRAEKLRDVQWQSLESIHATVPAGLDEGEWDLLLMGPSMDLLLESAFYVGHSLPVALRAEQEGDPPTPGREFDLRVQAVDEREIVVEIPVELAVEVSGSLELVQGFEDDGGWLPSGGGSIRLRATSVGEGTVSLISPSIPRQDVAIRVVSGTVEDVHIDVEAESVVAGSAVPFSVRAVDSIGQTAWTQDTILVRDACGGWSDLVELTDGVGAGVAYPTVACETSRLTTDNFPSASQGFTVEPAQTANAHIVELQGVVTAGYDLPLLIQTTDTYGNRSDWDPTSVSVSDSSGSLVAMSCVAGSMQGDWLCSATPTVAATTQTLSITSSGSVLGVSGVFKVIADSLATAQLVGPGLVQAGDSFDVVWTGFDRHGNGTAVDQPVLPGCDGPSASGLSWRFACRKEDAGTHTYEAAVNAVNVLTVVQVSPAEVSVGDLAAAASMTAGQTLALGVATWDAFGNASSFTSGLEVRWSGGATPVMYDSLGQASLQLQLIEAGQQEVALYEGSNQLASSTIDVLPAAASDLQVTPKPGWGFVGESWTVEVVAVDPYGNIAHVDDPVVVDIGTASATGAFESGRAQLTVLPDAASLSEDVLASSGSLTGDSADHPVMTRCEHLAPVLVFPGVGGARVCTGSQLAVDISTSGVLSRVEILDQAASAGGPASLSVLVDQTGSWPVRAAAWDWNACGAETVGTVYAHDTLGEAVGPVTLHPPSGNVAVGSTVSVDVDPPVDCAGDAVDADLTIVSSLGDPAGTAESLGWTVAIPAVGGSFDLVLPSAAEGGEVRVTAHGLTVGTTVFNTTGDGVGPVLVDVIELADGAELVYDEPLWDGPMASGDVVVDGVETSSVVFAARDSSLDVSWPIGLAATSVDLNDQLRDIEGNRVEPLFYSLGLQPVDAPACTIPAAATLRGTGLAFAEFSWDDGLEGVVELSRNGVHVRTLAGFSPIDWDGRDRRGHLVASGDLDVSVRSHESGARSPACTGSLQLTSY